MPNQKQQTAELETAGGSSTVPGASAKAAKAAKAAKVSRDSDPAAKAPKAPNPEGAAPKATKKAVDSGTAKIPRKRAVKPASKASPVDAEPQGFHENPAVNQALTQAVTYEMIAVRAYFLAENRQSNGHPGDHDADWLEAERQLKAESTSIASSLRKAR